MPRHYTNVAKNVAKSPAEICETGQQVKREGNSKKNILQNPYGDDYPNYVAEKCHFKIWLELGCGGAHHTLWDFIDILKDIESLYAEDWMWPGNRATLDDADKRILLHVQNYKKNECYISFISFAIFIPHYIALEMIYIII